MKNIKSLLPFTILLAFGLACVNTKQPDTRPEILKNAERKNAERKTSDTPRPINATVKINRFTVTVTNNDTSDFPSVRMKINMGGMGGYDGVYDGGTLKAGKTMSVPLVEFTNGSDRFNPFTKKVQSIYLKSGDGAASMFYF